LCISCVLTTADKDDDKDDDDDDDDDDVDPVIFATFALQLDDTQLSAKIFIYSNFCLRTFHFE